MSSGDQEVFQKKTKNSEELVLRDLQTLLRKSINNEVTVVDYKTESLLAKGENYGSTMFKVDAIIKKSKDSPEEKLFLVAKMVPLSDLKEMLMLGAIFSKETFSIIRLSQIYRELEKESGIEEKDLIDVWPKCYGARLTLKEDEPESTDNDAVILMENLQERGYKIMNRFQGLDYDHAKLAITELAHFHAVGMAVWMKKPKMFDEIKESLCVSVIDIVKNQLLAESENIIKILCEDPRIAPYEDRIRTSFGNDLSYASMVNWEIVEPWISVCHNDFWINNIMFHHDENERVDGIKFVDFQTTRIFSPMKDVPYFMCANLSPETIRGHFDELLDMYYNKLIDSLKKLDCDTSLYSRKNFDEQLKKDTKDELFHCLLAMKFFTYDVKHDDDLSQVNSTILLSKGNYLFIERSWVVITKFIEMGWL